MFKYNLQITFALILYFMLLYISQDDGQRKPTVKIGVVGKQDGIEIETNQILQKQDSSTVNRFDGSVPSNVILFDGVYCGSSTSNVNPDGNNVGKLQHSTSNAIRDEYCWMDSPPDLISERPIDVGWVGGWATEFDILLADPIGIKVFSVSFCSCSTRSLCLNVSTLVDICLVKKVEIVIEWHHHYLTSFSFARVHITLHSNCWIQDLATI